MERLLRHLGWIKWIVMAVFTAGGAWALVNAKLDLAGKPTPLFQTVEAHSAAISNHERRLAVHDEAVSSLKEDVRYIRSGVSELIRESRGRR